MAGKEIWTVSRLKMRASCPFKEHLRYDEELVPRASKMSLNIGSAVHKGIETQSIEAALETLNRIQPDTQEEADEIEIVKATVEALLTGYFERFQPFEDHEPEKAWELPLLLPSGRKSRKHFLAGKIDDIVHTPDGDWIVEYKTASQLTGAYFDRLYIDDQITLYYYAAKRMGYHPIGVIYRVIRKPTIRIRKGENNIQFCERLKADIKERPDYYYTEQRLYRSDDDLIKFAQDTYWRIKLIEKEKEKNLHLRSTGSCAMFGQCEYLPLCTDGYDASAYLYENKAPHEELKDDKEEFTWQ